MKKSIDLNFYVFSFNRGRFLNNCINSIRNCAPGSPIIIIDDNSDDPDTKHFISLHRKTCEVLFNNRESEFEKKTGGLAGCMNLAMRHAKEIGAPYVVFIQDDMQMVRSLKEDDMGLIKDYFSHVPGSIQISTSFIRRLSMDTFSMDHVVNIEAGAYIRKGVAERGKSNFSDTGVFDVNRFHETFKVFCVGEDKNSEKARSLGLTCGRSIYPFMCWLPYPVSHRGKKRGWRHRFFEKFGRSGFYPIRVMSGQERNSFVVRDAFDYPVMEEYLCSPSSPRSDIWSTGGGEYNFLAFNGVAAKIFRVMRIFKTWGKNVVA